MVIIKRPIIKCHQCGKYLKQSCFYKKGGGYYSPCKDCYKKYSIPSQYRKDVRFKTLCKQYGITPEIYYQILNTQNNRCSICNREQSEFTKKFAIDHNHETGVVRGLLCLNCNTAIGKLNDNVDLLSKAIRYLQNHE